MFKTIVAGTDGSGSARAAVQKAAELAKASDATLHLVMAYKLASQALLAAPMGEAIVAGAPATDAAIAKDVEQSLDQVARELRADGLTVETYACAQNPVQAILDVAETHDADLIVVGNRGMQGKRRLLGSVPNTIAHHASCSVLIVGTT
jgi:nucleotide-binding universal stress UspA family protein